MIKKKTVFIFFLFICLTAILYVNITNAPFYFDDFDRIKDNPYVRITELDCRQLWKAVNNPYSPKSRPIGSVTFAINYYFHQYDLLGYHLVNIIIHLFNGFLLFLFLRTILILDHSDNVSGKSKTGTRNTHIWIALFSSVIWLSHPLHTNSVTYIVQRVNSMATMFYMSSFLLYVKGRTLWQWEKSYNIKSSGMSPYIYYAGSGFCWLLALGSKQITAVLPVMITVFELFFFQNLNYKFVKRYMKYAIIPAIILLGVTLLFVGLSPLERILSIKDYANGEFTYIERILTEPRVVIYYLSLIIFPHPSRLNFDYDYPLSLSLTNPFYTVISILAIITLILFSLSIARRNRLVSFCIIWFFGNFVIESSIIPIAIIFEYRTYLPSMLLPFLFSILAVGQIANKKIWALLMIAVAFSFTIWTSQRNQVWRNEYALLADNVKKSPDKWRPRTGLGLFLASQGKYESALQHYHEALQHIPDSGELHYNIGATYNSQKKYEKAAEYYSKAIQLDPDLVDAMNRLGPILEEKGEVEEAIQIYQKSLSIKPNNSENHFRLANLLKAKGNIDEALVHYSTALMIQPKLKQSHYNIGVILVKKNIIKDAIKSFQKAVEIDPKFLEAHLYLASLYQKMKAHDMALYHYAESLKIKPDAAKIYYQMGVIFVSQNKLDKALNHFATAVRINPDFTAARDSYNNIIKYKNNSLQHKSNN